MSSKIALCAFCLLCFAAYPLSFLDRFFENGPKWDLGRTETAQNVDFKWTETDRHHVLTITPKGDVPLEIEIKDGMVRVSGKVVKEERVERNGVRTQSSYLSQFSLAEGIPEGADEDAAKTEQVGQSIRISFPKKKSSAKILRDIQVPGKKI